MNETQRESGEPCHWPRHQTWNYHGQEAGSTRGRTQVKARGKIINKEEEWRPQTGEEKSASSFFTRPTPSLSTILSALGPPHVFSGQKRPAGGSVHRGECSRWTAVEAEGLVCSQATVLLLCCSFRPKPLIAPRPVPALKGAIMFPSSKQLTVGVFFVCWTKSECFSSFQFRFY